MRLFSHRYKNEAHLGAWREGHAVDLGPDSLLAVLQENRLAALQGRIAKAAELGPEGIRYLPLIAQPPKIVCVGLNYREHRDEAGVKPSADYPDFFMRAATSLTAHGDCIEKPRGCNSLDFEGELAVVIGARGRRLFADDALHVVAGYSVFNEGSVREYQFRASQWTWGKNFDRTGGFGPDLVTPDELPRSVKEGLQLQTRLNGQVMQSASTADLIFDLPALLVMLSEAMTLEPGDVIVTGTPSGVGLARKPPLYMAAGDVVEIEIEGVGLLRNTVRDEPAALPGNT